MTTCPYRDDCPHTLKLSPHSLTVLDAFYCKGLPLMCKRYTLRQADQPVPDDLLPSGALLGDVGLAPGPAKPEGG